jgi:hypothetical protein
MPTTDTLSLFEEQWGEGRRREEDGERAEKKRRRALLPILVSHFPVIITRAYPVQCPQ